MSVLTAAWGLGSLAVLAWMLSRLLQAPRDVPLWSVTTMIACWATAYPFAVASGKDAEFLGLAPMASFLIYNTLMLFSVNCLVSFFLFSALSPAQARRRALWYLLPLVVVVAVQIAAAQATPPGVSTKDHTVTSVLVLTLASVLHFTFGFALACVWTRRYARKAEPRLARGLRIASLGLAAILVSECLYIPMLFMRWANDDTSKPALDPDNAAATLGFVAGAFFLLPGAVLLLIGISYQSVAMRLVALRIWWRHLRAYRRLRPLWTLLHRHFPEDTLHRVPTGRWRDAVSLRGVHRRYYRRVIECRDGLVHISPYLAAVRHRGGGTGDGGRETPTAAVMADHLKEALRARTAGTSVSTSAVPVVIPEENNLEADVQELIALSQALRAA